MTITPQLQDILTTIHRNQAQIDLLTANNSQLTHFLLHAGMIQNIRDLNVPMPPLVNGHVALPEPQAQPRRGRPSKTMLEAMGVPATPTTKTRRKKTRMVVPKNENDLPQSEYIIQFAQSNNGKFFVREFRTAHHTQTFAPSFFETTIYSVLAKLVKQGMMKKVDVGHYELTAKKKPIKST